MKTSGTKAPIMTRHNDSITGPKPLDTPLSGLPNPGLPNAGPSNAGPSNAGPSNPGPSNPGPSNPGPSNAGLPQPGLPLLAALESYWRELRGARCLPVRTEVDPGRIDAALPHAMILERIAPGMARLRVAGEAICQLSGTEARGLPLSSLFALSSRDTLAALLEPVFAAPALVELPLVQPRSLWRARVTGRLLILPLLGRQGLVDRALALLVTDTAAHPGRAFDIAGDGVFRHEPLSHTDRLAAPPGMVAQVGGGPMAAAPRARPQLRLVVSNG